MSDPGLSRRTDIDFLKGLAVVAVVLYHMGLLESGYLGVDVFFVVSGYLVGPKLLRQMDERRFSYTRFIGGRVMRLLPAVLIAAALCLAVGYVFWLPDDYENMAESVIASTVFANNILSAITTKNYWDSINDYKPLMHMWYLGILMQFYLIFPLVIGLLKKLAFIVRKRSEDVIRWGCAIFAVASLTLFWLPGVATQGDKFYFLPFRLYELFAGVLAGTMAGKGCERKGLRVLSLCALIGLLLIGVFTFDPSAIGAETAVIGGESRTSALLLPNAVLVPMVVLFSVLFLARNEGEGLFRKARLLSVLGKRSYSLFVWHQVLLALYRYSVTSAVTLLSVAAFIALLAVVSSLSYRLLEAKKSAARPGITAAFACLLCLFSGCIYLRAGVVRDVPELGIAVEDIHRGMHGEYCDRIYQYDRDFQTQDRIKVLVVGNSFARDFGNVLLESSYADSIELSYSPAFDPVLRDRIQSAERIFVFCSRDEVPDYLWENVRDADIVYGIGTKNFGTLNGQIYFRRFSDDYFGQTVALDPGYKAANEALRAQWGERYIDMIEPVTSDGRVRIFTDTNMYISQDTRHLTRAGAQYYASLLDLGALLE